METEQENAWRILKRSKSLDDAFRIVLNELKDDVVLWRNNGYSVAEVRNKITEYLIPYGWTFEEITSAGAGRITFLYGSQEDIFTEMEGKSLEQLYWFEAIYGDFTGSEVSKLLKERIEELEKQGKQ